MTVDRIDFELSNYIYYGYHGKNKLSKRYFHFNFKTFNILLTH